MCLGMDTVGQKTFFSQTRSEDAQEVSSTVPCLGRRFYLLAGSFSGPAIGFVWEDNPDIQATDYSTPLQSNPSVLTSHSPASL